MPEHEATQADFDLARGALLEITPADTIGVPAGFVDEGDGTISVFFESEMAGYPGWRWTASIAHVDGAEPTVLEVELMPGDTAILAPDWVPWVDRLAEYRASQHAAASGDDSDDDDDDSDEESDDDSDHDDGDDEYSDDDDEDEDEDGDDDDSGDRDTVSRGSVLHAGDLDGVDIDDIVIDADESADDDESDYDEESDDDPIVGDLDDHVMDDDEISRG